MTAIQPVTPPRVALTAAKQKWEVGPELQGKLCLTNDNVLHIVDGYQANPYVMAFVQRLRVANVTYKPEFVSPEQLKDIYQEATLFSGASKHYSAKSEDTASHSQKDVVAIFQDATKAGASDIHFFATPNGHKLRYRIHGELETVKTFVGDDGKKLLGTIYGSMSENTDTNYRPEAKQDGRLRSEYVNEAGLFGARIATRPTLNGPWMALRLLYDSGIKLSLDDMGYLPAQVDALTRLIHRIDGIVFMTGTTGSGKSTTIQILMTMLIEAMGDSINLTTVEDPVEYRIPGANQTPLKEEWADAIANLMRLDPDVLVVGETRDRASALAAFQAALTGHGVWSTLHVNSAAASLQRLRDLGVEDNLLFDPSLIKGLINQSLTRKLCNHCKVPYLKSKTPVSKDLRSRIEANCTPELVFMKGDGCAQCHGRGIIGRTAIAEIIQPDLEFMRVMREHGKPEAQAFWVREQGGITKNAHLIQRINEGMVDPTCGERDVCALDDDVASLGIKR